MPSKEPPITPAEWAIQTRRAQGLPDHVEDPAVLAEFADAVLEAMQAKGDQEPDERI
jgi:hypothetical protein